MFYNDYLKKVKICPFCMLVKDEILKENKNAMLILAKAPYTKDHLLVVPKKHVLSLTKLNKKEKGDIDNLVDFGMKKLSKKYHNVSILYRQGDKEKIGKSIDHAHYHIIPNLMIGSTDIHLTKRKILSEKDYLKLIEKTKKDL